MQPLSSLRGLMKVALRGLLRGLNSSPLQIKGYPQLLRKVKMVLFIVCLQCIVSCVYIVLSCVYMIFSVVVNCLAVIYLSIIM